MPLHQTNNHPTLQSTLVLLAYYTTLHTTRKCTPVRTLQRTKKGAHTTRTHRLPLLIKTTPTLAILLVFLLNWRARFAHFAPLYAKALCEGFDEVREAFRAVQWFTPTPEAPAEVEQIGANRFVVRTRIRYKVPGWGGPGFVVPSEVVVTTVSAEAAEAGWRGYPQEGKDDGAGEEEVGGSESGGDVLRAEARARMIHVTAAKVGLSKLSSVYP
jgi:hypothetical protein